MSHEPPQALLLVCQPLNESNEKKKKLKKKQKKENSQLTIGKWKTVKNCQKYILVSTFSESFAF